MIYAHGSIAKITSLTLDKFYSPRMCSLDKNLATPPDGKFGAIEDGFPGNNWNCIAPESHCLNCQTLQCFLFDRAPH